MNTKAPLGILARPLDFYVAFLVFMMGLYGFIDPSWPEKFDWPVWAILMFEDAYLLAAGGAIMTALIMRQWGKKIVATLVVEMFSWLFVASAAWVIVITSYWIPPSAFLDAEQYDLMFWVWVILWFNLGAAALTRYLDMRKWYRGGRNS